MSYYFGYKAPGTADNGVYHYIQSKYPCLISEEAHKDRSGNKLFAEMNKIMRVFLKSNDLPCKDNGKFYSTQYNAAQIQKNFQKFADWIKSYQPLQSV